MTITEIELKNWVEAVIISASKPITEAELLALWDEDKPSLGVLRAAIHQVQQECEGRGVELVAVASGYRFQAKPEWAPWIGKLYTEKPARYSRALLETLALIAYRQPITRGEIEEIRGVSISQSIFKTLHEEREWIRIVGHRAVPGKPALYATTKEFLDYFGLNSLEQLPLLPELMNMDILGAVHDSMSAENESTSEPEAIIEQDIEHTNVDLIKQEA